MQTDDILTDFLGSKFLGVTIKYAPNIVSDDEWIEHEVQFLEILTSKGSITLSTHNEHNGYYGGFNIVMGED